jgi:anaerobic selenocysteine-containing dehydrogenase
LFIHATDAAPRGILTGDAVRVFNDRGTCLLTAELDGVTRPGVVRAPSVRWAKKSPGGTNVNVLTSPKLTDMGGGPTFYNCLVEVEKCGD